MLLLVVVVVVVVQQSGQVVAVDVLTEAQSPRQHMVVLYSSSL